MHQALTSGEVRTFTSHFHPGASFRNTAVCGMRRLAIPRTRSTCLGSWLTLPFGVSVWIVFWYSSDAALSISSEETRRNWLRWTPTAPCSVVVEHPAIIITATAAALVRRVIRPGIDTPLVLRATAPPGYSDSERLAVLLGVCRLARRPTIICARSATDTTLLRSVPYTCRCGSLWSAPVPVSPSWVQTLV